MLQRLAWNYSLESIGRGVGLAPTFAGHLQLTLATQLARVALDVKLARDRLSRTSVTIDSGKKMLDELASRGCEEAVAACCGDLPHSCRIVSQFTEGTIAKLNETGASPHFAYGAEFVSSSGYGPTHDWGLIVDPIEGTTRCAKGKPSGSLVAMTLTQRASTISGSYEGYFGMLVLPKTVAALAAKAGVTLDLLTPRQIVTDWVLLAYSWLKPSDLVVHMLDRPSRLSNLRQQWRDSGVTLTDENFHFPGCMPVITDSGTVAPSVRVGTFRDHDGKSRVFILDGYSGSVEALLVAAMDSAHNTATSMCLLEPKLDGQLDACRLEPYCQYSNPRAFFEALENRHGRPISPSEYKRYREAIAHAQHLGLPLTAVFSMKDLYGGKDVDCLTLLAFITDDPYSGSKGVEAMREGRYRVHVRSASTSGVDNLQFLFSAGKAQTSALAA